MNSAIIEEVHYCIMILVKRLRKIEPYLYLIPSAIILILFSYYPFITEIIASFFRVDSFGRVKSFIGLGNYFTLFQNDKFIQAIGNTLLYAAVTVPFSIAIGFILAMLARKRLKLSSAYEALFTIPMAASMSVIAMIFQLALNPTLGIINKLFGLNINWLQTQSTAFWCLMLIQVWLNIGFNFLFSLSALRGIPNEILESSEMDGAVGLRKLVKIIIPLVSPTIFFLFCSSIARAMMASSLTLIMTGDGSNGSTGGPNGSTEMIVSYLYREAILNQNYNIGYASAVIGFLMSFALILLSFIYEKKGVYYN